MVGTKDDPKSPPKEVSSADLEKLLKDYDDIANAYKAQWEMSIYALEPQFHYDVAKIYEELKMRKNFTDKDHPHNPEFSYDHIVAGNIKDSIDAITQAKEKMDRRVMGAHAKAVAEAAEKSNPTVPAATPNTGGPASVASKPVNDADAAGLNNVTGLR